MRGVNKVILVGTLGRDPEVRFAANGTEVANLSVATSEQWKDQQGNKQEKTEWHRVVIFGRLAEVVGQYLHKGSKIYVEGRLQTREWEKDGIKRYTTEVIVDMRGSMQMLDGKQDGQQSHAQPNNRSQQQQQRPAQQQQYDQQYNHTFDDDQSIPF